MTTRSSSSSISTKASDMAGIRNLQNMDVLSASSLEYASNPTDEILVGLDSLDDAPSEAIRDSEKEKRLVTINGTCDFGLSKHKMFKGFLYPMQETESLTIKL